jgi:putative endonuclease
MSQKQFVGKYGEDLAAQYLEDRGYEILERNWRCAAGEIDLIAKQKEKIVFVEVKTRTGLGYGHPFEAITSAKSARMRKLVAQWCQQNQTSGLQVRVDAIAVMIRNGKVALEHLKQVF